jgi:hypothetical protein
MEKLFESRRSDSFVTELKNILMPERVQHQKKTTQFGIFCPL